MRTLDKKLLRDFRRLWPQALAVALVLASGVATLIMAIGAYRSLTETRQAYYERNRFADLFATATRAPRSLGAAMARIDGVAAVETRITESVVLDIPGMNEPATGLVLSLPDHGRARLNRLYIRAGHLPTPGKTGEIVISDVFAREHGYKVGSQFSGTLAGHRIRFRVTGLVLSPEFIYALGPGDLVPDHRRFAVIWMRRRQLEGLTRLDDAFNSVILTLQPGVRQQAVMDTVDRMLKPYGGTGAYGRKDQTSHAFLDSELKALKGMAKVIPPIFLFVSAFLINMVLSRLIALEREQIGLLKALGFGRRAVALHYVKFVVVIALAGIAIGFAAGTWLGDGMTRIYARFYNFPFLIFLRSADIYLLSAGISLAAALAGALKAVLAAAALPPAVAMQPAAPTLYRKTGLAGRWLAAMVSQLTVMAFRHLWRWPLRTGLTMLGTALAVALLVTAVFITGSINFLIDTWFFRTDRQDATITFTSALGPDSLQAVARLPGVLGAEPFRAMLVELSRGPLKRRLVLTGKPENMRLSRILDMDLKPVSLPRAGVVLTERVARYLRARRGDLVDVKLLEEGGRQVQLPVTDIIQSYLGLGAYMDLRALDRLSRLGPRRSGAYVKLDMARSTALFDAIKTMPAAASIGLRALSLKKFRESIEQNITIMNGVYTVLSVIIAFGVAYNSARIQLSERAREFASLRVLGFTRREVASVMMIEVAVLALLAQPLGWLLGYGFAWAVMRGFQNDIYRMPFVVEMSAFGWSSLAVLAATALSALLVLTRVRKLDMIRALKTKE